MTKYYEGNKLLSLKDLNGRTPEIYICTSNRSAGKTTFFNRYLIKKFKNKGEKFLLLYRYKYELSQVSDKFFKDIKNYFFKTDEMTSVSKAKGLFVELLLNDISCGYAVALNSADNLKKYSHLFSDTKRILFDEFQTENNQYCSNEVKKFISIHTSVARGQGAQSRYVPVYMLSNTVNVLNPYYVELGISERLQPNTKFLRGNGYVLEQGYNESAKNAQVNSAFMSAFNNTYVDYSINGSYLYSDSAFIEKISGLNRYLCTIKFDGVEYAIREYPELNIVYCDTNIDSSNKFKIAVTTTDHNINYSLVNNSNLMVGVLRQYFNEGLFRFKNISCKKAVLNFLKY